MPKFELTDECQKIAPESIAFLDEIVKKASVALSQGGGNIPLMNLALKASSTILAYGYGTPISRQELSGEVQLQSTIDPSTLSMEALKELIAARRKAGENKE